MEMNVTPCGDECNTGVSFNLPFGLQEMVLWHGLTSGGKAVGFLSYVSGDL